MLIEKTLYNMRIAKGEEGYTVYYKGSFQAKGFTDTESALKAIHVLEGIKPDDFYTEVDGIVLKNTKLHKEEEENQ